MIAEGRARGKSHRNSGRIPPNVAGVERAVEDWHEIDKDSIAPFRIHTGFEIFSIFFEGPENHPRFYVP